MDDFPDIASLGLPEGLATNIGSGQPTSASAPAGRTVRFHDADTTEMPGPVAPEYAPKDSNNKPPARARLTKPTLEPFKHTITGKQRNHELFLSAISYKRDPSVLTSRLAGVAVGKNKPEVRLAKNVRFYTRQCHCQPSCRGCAECTSNGNPMERPGGNQYDTDVTGGDDSKPYKSERDRFSGADITDSTDIDKLISSLDWLETNKHTGLNGSQKEGGVPGYFGTGSTGIIGDTPGDTSRFGNTLSPESRYPHLHKYGQPQGAAGNQDTPPPRYPSQTSLGRGQFTKSQQRVTRRQTVNGNTPVPKTLLTSGDSTTTENYTSTKTKRDELGKLLQDVRGKIVNKRKTYTTLDDFGEGLSGVVDKLLKKMQQIVNNAGQNYSNENTDMWGGEYALNYYSYYNNSSAPAKDIRQRWRDDFITKNMKDGLGITNTTPQEKVEEITTNITALYNLLAVDYLKAPIIPFETIKKAFPRGVDELPADVDLNKTTTDNIQTAVKNNISELKEIVDNYLTSTAKSKNE